jgi:hypothetical protein
LQHRAARSGGSKRSKLSRLTGMLLKTSIKTSRAPTLNPIHKFNHIRRATAAPFLFVNILMYFRSENKVYTCKNGS